MKSQALHKLLTLLTFLLLLLCGYVWSLPLDQQPVGVQPQQPEGVQAQHPAGVQPQQQMLLIQHNMSPDQAPNYQISIPKAPQPNEPCLTISWKANPDGSEPDMPQIYLVNGYFQIMSPHVASAQH